jgi:Peptidase family M28
MFVSIRLAAVAALVTRGLAAQAPPPAPVSHSLPLKHAPASTTAAITPADLMTRLYIYSDDSMMGREAGTPWNLKATAYIADQVRRMGLRPAGDSGTFFQDVPLVRSVFDSTTGITADGVTLEPWKDYIPRDQQVPMRPLTDAPAVFAGVWGDSAMLPAEQAAGKLVVIAVPTGVGPNGQPRWLISRLAVTNRYRGAAGIAVASMDLMPPQFQVGFRNPGPQLKGAAPAQTDTAAVPSYLYVTAAAARGLFGAPLDSLKAGAVGKTVRGRFAFVDVKAPARNVVAILPGSDSKLKGQYVAIGAHNDHIGFDTSPVDHDSLRAHNEVIRPSGADSPERPATPAEQARISQILDSLRKAHPARLDSISNGADDDGSGTVTVLEIAEQFARARPAPKRSLLFIWHTGEELGLFGSQWFTDHPTVSRDSIVAELNIDMVGRGDSADTQGGGPAYLQLIGSRRLSTELGDMVETVNKTEPHPFTFDYQYDANGHPEQYYCRSDHYMYARYGIPIVFFTTGNHEDYHQVTDEPQYIDYAHMARVAQLVADMARTVANLDHRVVVDKPKPDPNGQCRQ